MSKIAVIAGDGIGPAVIEQTLRAASVMEKKYKLALHFDLFPFGAEYYLATGTTIPESVFREWPQRYSGVLLGALGDARVPSNIHAHDILMGLRRKLDLYVNFRPVKLLNKRYCPLKHVKDEAAVDFVVFRENTEDLYVSSGGYLKKNTRDEVVVENSLHTYKGVSRILRAAFSYARAAGSPSVVLGDKSNVMIYSGDLWQRLFEKTKAQFPGIKGEHMYIDALCMEIIRNPSRFSVIVTTNMFGDILTDLAAQVQGGMGLAASANYNPARKNFLGLFEPVHGSAPDIANQNIANPLAAVLSFHLMLTFMGLRQPAAALYRTVKKILAERRVTPDLGGNYTTSEVGDFLSKYLEKDETCP
jgi:3-isopropylmalate dehydrogenase